MAAPPPGPSRARDPSRYCRLVVLLVLLVLQLVLLVLLVLLWRQAVQHYPSALALWGVTRMVLLVLLVLVVLQLVLLRLVVRLLAAV